MEKGAQQIQARSPPCFFFPQMFSDLDERILKASFQEKILKANKKWMKEYLKLTEKYFGLHLVFVQSLAYL